MSERFRHRIGGQKLSGKLARGGNPALPVILAVHGGTYSCDYFDVPGHSLIELAAARGFDIVAVDRPGYGHSTPLPEADEIIRTNAEALNAAVPGLLGALGLGDRPVFLIGHSIGGAIALTLAAIASGWQLVGVAVSGVGDETPPESAEAYAQLPRQYFVELPAPMKDAVMFGPEGTHPPGMPQASHIANSTVPLCELLDITGGWMDRVAGIAGAITVPVHYRQGEHEKLWLNSPERVAAFGRLFTRSPRVDAGMVADAGHCIDFHHAGAAFQSAQLDFAAASVRG